MIVLGESYSLKERYWKRTRAYLKWVIVLVKSTKYKPCCNEMGREMPITTNSVCKRGFDDCYVMYKTKSTNI